MRRSTFERGSAPGRGPAPNRGSAPYSEALLGLERSHDFGSDPLPKFVTFDSNSTFRGSVILRCAKKKSVFQADNRNQRTQTYIHTHTYNTVADPGGG